MDKKLFLLAGAALALTACSNEEPVAINNGNAIGFRTAVSSRGETMTTAELSTFTVTSFDSNGAKYIDAVAYNNVDGTYKSDPEIYYWPKATTLDFLAVANLTKDGESVTNDLTGATVTLAGEEGSKAITLTVTDFEPKQTVESQTDLIAAIEEGATEPESGATPLIFKHMLSQIMIYAKNGNTAYTYEVTGVRVGGVLKKGTLTHNSTATTWAVAEEHTAETVVGSDDGKGYSITWAETEGNIVELGSTPTLLTKSATEPAEGNAPENLMMLVPQDLSDFAWDPDAQIKATDHSYDYNAYIAVKVKITSKGGTVVYPVDEADGSFAWVAVPISTNWEPGSKYVYTLNFTNGAGRVDPEKPYAEDDTFNAGDEILGGPIEFSVTEITDWTLSNENLDHTGATETKDSNEEEFEDPDFGEGD